MANPELQANEQLAAVLGTFQLRIIEDPSKQSRLLVSRSDDSWGRFLFATDGRNKWLKLLACFSCLACKFL